MKARFLALFLVAAVVSPPRGVAAENRLGRLAGRAVGEAATVVIEGSEPPTFSTGSGEGRLVIDFAGAALAGVPELAGVAVEPGERAEVVVVLVVRPGLDRAALDGVVARVNEALAANATVAERVDSLELRLRN